MPGIQIVGPGNNRSAEVNDLGKLRTTATSTAPEYGINLNNGLAFYLQTIITPASGGVFLYIKNTYEYPMILENMFVTADTDENITIYRSPTGTPTGTNNTTPSNSNFGSNKIATGDFLYGSDIGGLSYSEVYNTLPVFANTNNAYTFRNWIVLLRNSTICFAATTGTIELDISLPFFYLPGEL